MPLASMLKKKQKQLKLSAYQLAKKLRISFVTVQRVLDASSRPNVRTIAKYAKFLGLSAAALEKKLGPSKARGRAVGKRSKVKAKRGRKGARA